MYTLTRLVNEKTGKQMEKVYSEIREVSEKKIKLEIYVDDFDLTAIFGGLDGNWLSFDFGDFEENMRYLQKFKDEEISSYGVIAKEMCDCCGEWRRKDSLWAIHTSSPREALEYFMDNYYEENII
jgi:hypothetical protein